MYILHSITCTCCFSFPLTIIRYIWYIWYNHMRELVKFSIKGGVTMPPTQRATKATGETLTHFDVVEKAKPKRVKSQKDALLILCRSTGWRTRWRSKWRGTTTSSSLLTVTSSSSRLDNLLILSLSKMSTRIVFSKTKMCQVTKLMLPQVRPDDVGNYTCVAENLINRRVSPPARLDIFGITFISFTFFHKNVSSPFFHPFPWC